MRQFFLISGAVLGFLSVAFGAFAAHALKGQLDSYSLQIWQTAVSYQMYHALAILVVACLTKPASRSLLKWSGVSFIWGILLFSGSLYLLALIKINIIGLITPVGGTLLLLGWLLLLIYAVKEEK